MDDEAAKTRAALARQLAAMEELQRELAERLRHADAEAATPAAPWLSRRGVANGAAAPRTLPPWLARRGR